MHKSIDKISGLVYSVIIQRASPSGRNTMTKETFMKSRIEMGYTWFEALSQWNRQNQKSEQKDTTEIYQDTLDEIYK